MFKVISDQDNGGVSYATQYHCASEKEYNTYIEHYAKNLRQDAIDRFGTSILAFRTQLEEIITVMKAVRPKKQLGQHFLTDLSIAEKIAKTLDFSNYSSYLKLVLAWEYSLNFFRGKKEK